MNSFKFADVCKLLPFKKLLIIDINFMKAVCGLVSVVRFRTDARVASTVYESNLDRPHRTALPDYVPLLVGFKATRCSFTLEVAWLLD